MSEAVDELQSRIASFVKELRSLQRQLHVCGRLVSTLDSTQAVLPLSASLNAQSMTCHLFSLSVREERWDTSYLDHSRHERNDIDDLGASKQATSLQCCPVHHVRRDRSRRGRGRREGEEEDEGKRTRGEGDSSRL